MNAPGVAPGVLQPIPLGAQLMQWVLANSDPGISVSFMYPIPFVPAPIMGGGGVELIYDGPAGPTATGWQVYAYPQIGLATSPGVSITPQASFNFQPQNYIGPFVNVAGSIISPLGVGGTAGFSATPSDWLTLFMGPNPGPQTLYIGGQLGPPGPGLQGAFQWYFWIYGTPPPGLPPGAPRPLFLAGELGP